MPKPAPAAATMQSCLLRLQSLQQQFLHIDSPGELADAEQEGGHILALLLQGKHIEPDTLIPNSRDLLLDYAAGALDWQPMDNRLAEHYQLSLWTFLAMGCSDQPRVVLHDAGPAPAWTYSITNGEHKYEHRWPADVRLKTTDRAKDFRQQGKRYSLWVSELLARIQTATAGQHTKEPSVGHVPARRDFTEGELRDALDLLLRKSKRYYSQQQAADELNRLHPDKKVGKSRVGECELWKDHAKQFGKDRAPRNTSKEAANQVTRRLAAQQQRNIDADERKRVKGHRIQGTD